MPEEHVPRKSVVSQPATVKKKTFGDRLAQAFMPEDFSSVTKHWGEKLKNCIRDAAFEFLDDAIEAFFYGSENTTAARRRQQSNLGYRTNYNAISTNRNNRSANRSAQNPNANAYRSTSDSIDIEVQTMQDAREVKRSILELIAEYGEAKVSDAMEFAGLQPQFPQDEYGWDQTMLNENTIRISKTTAGTYVIKFPAVIKIK